MESKKHLDGEHVALFFEGVVDCFNGDAKKEYPAKYRDLSRKVNEIWKYKNWSDKSEEQIFLYGSMWGVMQLMQARQEQMQKSVDENTLFANYKKYAWIFKAIKKNPGIRHCDLAQKAKITPSALSQSISRMISDDVISFSRIGREKYYFLTPCGERILELIREEEMLQKKRNEENYFQKEAIERLVASIRADVRSNQNVVPYSDMKDRCFIADIGNRNESRRNNLVWNMKILEKNMSTNYQNY